jgi:hypothetical protein
MGASRVSSTLFDHKEQSAATKLQVDHSEDLQPSGKRLCIIWVNNLYQQLRTARAIILVFSWGVADSLYLILCISI